MTCIFHLLSSHTIPLNCPLLTAIYNTQYQCTYISDVIFLAILSVKGRNNKSAIIISEFCTFYHTLFQCCSFELFMFCISFLLNCSLSSCKSFAYFLKAPMCLDLGVCLSLPSAMFLASIATALVNLSCAF